MDRGTTGEDSMRMACLQGKMTDSFVGLCAGRHRVTHVRHQIQSALQPPGLLEFRTEAELEIWVRILK